MTKNKLGDLDNHLFAMLERLADEDLTSDEIDSEVKRADAIVSLADQVIGNAKLKLEAAKLYATHGPSIKDMLPQIGKSPSEKVEE